MSRTYCATPPVSNDPSDLFAFALDQLTWEHVRALLPVGESGRRWTVKSRTIAP